MEKHNMTLEQLGNVTVITSKLLESSAEDFILYISERPLGDLLGLRNYLKAEFERVKEVKDHLIEKGQKIGFPKKVKETVDELYKVLAVIENRHDIIEEFINNKQIKK